MKKYFFTIKFLNYSILGWVVFIPFYVTGEFDKQIGTASKPIIDESLPVSLQERTSRKLDYNPNWAYQNDASNNNFDQWFDGIVTGSTPGSPTSSELKNFFNPSRTYFDFPKELNFELEKIRLYDGEGTGEQPLKIILLLKTGEEIEEVVPNFTGNLYNQWHEYKIPDKFKSVRAVIYEFQRGGVYPTEIEFWGEYKPYTPTFPPFKRVKLKNMYGINSFPWNNSGKLPNNDPDVKPLLSRYNYMSWNRAYDDWPLFDNGTGEYRFAPTWSGGWNQDRGFARLKAKGVKNIQCIKTIPDYLLSRYPQSIGKDGTTDSRRTDRNGEAAYHKYKGNLVEYINFEAFPESGETSTLKFLLDSGEELLMFPYTLKQPTYFIAKDTQLVYKWDGSKYILLTKNVDNVYFEVYTDSNASVENPKGKLKTKYNDLCSKDRNDPATYIDYAKMAFQSAARYGSNTNIDPALVLTPDKKVGLNLIEGFEAGNELNAYWHGRRRYLSPYEQAALLSAVYDGHKGTMGPGVGVKNADPNLTVYNGGIVSANPSFFRAMIDWCEKYRGYRKDGSIDICWDVQKYHQYTNSKGLEQHIPGDRFAMPADMVPIATARIAKIKRMNYELLGRYLDVHIGEWGYDIGDSKQGAKEIYNPITGVTRSSRQTAADWIIRDQLEYCWYGVDAMQLYLLEDPSYYEGSPEENNRLYSTSGIFNRGDKKPSRAPRPSAWFSRQLSKYFGEYTPVERLSEDPRVQRHENDEGKSMYALWIPDMIGRQEEYTLNLPNITFIKAYSLVEGSDKMKENLIRIKGSYTLTVGETPIFIKIVK